LGRGVKTKHKRAGSFLKNLLLSKVKGDKESPIKRENKPLVKSGEHNRHLNRRKRAVSCLYDSLGNKLNGKTGCEIKAGRLVFWGLMLVSV